MKNPLGNNLKDWMTRHGYTQATLAEKLGVRQATVSDWVTTKSRPRVENLRAMAELTGVTLKELINKLSPIETAARPEVHEFGKRIEALAKQTMSAHRALIEERIASQKRVLAETEALIATARSGLARVTDPSAAAELRTMVDSCNTMKRSIEENIASLQRAKRTKPTNAAELESLARALAKA